MADFHFKGFVNKDTFLVLEEKGVSLHNWIHALTQAIIIFLKYCNDYIIDCRVVRVGWGLENAVFCLLLFLKNDFKFYLKRICERL